MEHDTHDTRDSLSVYDTCLPCQFTRVMPCQQEREKIVFLYKKESLEPISYFGHNRSRLTQNKLTF